MFADHLTTNSTGAGNEYYQNGSVSKKIFISAERCVQLHYSMTYVAPARISSIVLALVKLARMSRYDMVDIMTTMMRIEVVLMMLHTTTGIKSRKVIRNSNSPLAPRLIMVPE